MTKPVSDVFGSVCRFHVYDHQFDDWVMSGAVMDGGVAVDHAYEDGVEFLHDISHIEDNSELQIVWEDCDPDVESERLPPGLGGDIAEAVRQHIADTRGVDIEMVHLLSVEPCGEARFVIV